MSETKRPGPLEMLREDVELVTNAADLATGLFAIRHSRDLKNVTAAARDALVVRFAVTWLLANGLITAAPDSAFERTLPMDLPAKLAGDVGGKLHEAIARKADIDGASAAASLGVAVPARPGDWTE